MNAQELGAKLTYKRQELGNALEACKEANGGYDLTKHDYFGGSGDAAACYEKWEQHNAEINDLTDKHRQAKAVEDSAKALYTPHSEVAQDSQEQSVKGKVKSLGERFVEANKADPSLIYGKGLELENVEVAKALFRTPAGIAPVAEETGIYQRDAQRPLRVSEILPRLSTTGPSVAYYRQSTNTDNAAEIAEATALSGSTPAVGHYPEQAYAWTRVVQPVQKIGAFLPVTEEQLDDVQEARQLIEQILPYQVARRLDQQVINGTGAGLQLRGLIAAIAADAPAGNSIATSANEQVDTLRRVATAVSVASEIPPDSVIVHPTDLDIIRFAKDSNERYLYGDPGSATGFRPWGLNTIETTGIPAGTAIVGSFSDPSVVRLYLRSDVSFEYSNSHDDWFVRDVWALKASLRACLAVPFGAALGRATAFSTTS